MFAIQTTHMDISHSQENTRECSVGKRRTRNQGESRKGGKDKGSIGHVHVGAGDCARLEGTHDC